MEVFILPGIMATLMAIVLGTMIWNGREPKSYDPIAVELARSIKEDKGWGLEGVADVPLTLELSREHMKLRCTFWPAQVRITAYPTVNSTKLVGRDARLVARAVLGMRAKHEALMKESGRKAVLGALGIGPASTKKCCTRCGAKVS